MNTPANEISVAIIDGAACVRICGRANFNSSHDFRRLISELQKSGHNRFRMDLCDCLIMDSTFLGVLARLALDAGDAAETEAVKAFELISPSERVAGLLDNLGVLELFEVTEGQGFADAGLESAPAGPKPTRTEASKNSLAAHETLIEVNPANEAKFKDVIKFLAEDLAESGS
ncbi:MAG: STAS domain-containing protein [Verrucomicrobiia bacterium]|jgi:anti-anti-sigma regulatory factor